MSEILKDLKKELTEGTAQLLDVREQNEWDDGHLKGAILVPLSKLKSGEIENQDKLDFNKKTYLHCRSGGRVQMAAPILKAKGFNNLIPLGQGFSELVENGFEKS